MTRTSRAWHTRINKLAYSLDGNLGEAPTVLYHRSQRQLEGEQCLQQQLCRSSVTMCTIRTSFGPCPDSKVKHEYHLKGDALQVPGIAMTKLLITFGNVISLSRVGGSCSSSWIHAYLHPVVPWTWCAGRCISYFIPSLETKKVQPRQSYEGLI